MIRNYLLNIICYAIALIVGIWIGGSIFTKKNIDYSKDKIKFEMVAVKLNDSVKAVEKKVAKKQKDVQNLIVKSENLKQKSDDIVIQQPVNKECDELFEKTSSKIALLEDNLIVKDSVINIQKDIIRDKDSIIFLKDEIIQSDRRYALTLEKKLQKSKPTFVIGPSIGYGVVIQDKPVIKPHVGISLILNIF